MRGAFVLVFTVCLAGCELPFDDWDPPICRAPAPDTSQHVCQGLWIEPQLGREGSSIIIGDTAVLTIHSDYAVKTAGWAITGKSIIEWDGDKPSVTSRQAASITVKAIALGVSTVSVTNGGYWSTADFTVVDSSAIVQLLLNAPDQIRQGDSTTVSFAVQDANYFTYRTYPALSLSDSNVASVHRTVSIVYGEPRYTARLIARTEGTVNLTASFGKLTSSRTITVVP